MNNHHQKNINRIMATTDPSPTTTTTAVSSRSTMASAPKQQQVTMINPNLNKRKHDIASVQDFQSHSTVPKSTSSISISRRQVVPKKMKQKHHHPMMKPVTGGGDDENNSSLNKNYWFALLIRFLLHAIY